MSKVIFVDVDLTICRYASPRANHDYPLAIPILENIAKINKLYDEGNTIIYYTARGSRTGINWFDLTKHQLQEWGAKHHGLNCQKPYYDIIVDDKALRIEEL